MGLYFLQLRIKTQACSGDRLLLGTCFIGVNPGFFTAPRKNHGILHHHGNFFGGGRGEGGNWANWGGGLPPPPHRLNPVLLPLMPAFFPSNALYFNFRIVKLTSPNLSYFMIAGTIIIYSSVYFRLLPTTALSYARFLCSVSKEGVS